ncbi:MAG: cysteine--tRNA ligase [Acidobacteria bacterium]|nr:cysteine--tRNA ligase [Acidobacteriota bacterium]
MRLYNSLTKTIEEFSPREPGRVGLYTCGPTVHDFAHIGNFRAYAWEDLLRRHLEARGFVVHHVMNITDVEDKIIRKAAAAGSSLRDYTDRYTAAFFEDARTLRLLPAHVYPRATEHIPEMIELVGRLEAAGHTYLSEGSVYYRIGSFPGYGRLSGLDPDTLRAGARVDADEYEKDDPSDFVLWKAQKPGEPAWESPWGPGRPGWHIECSAMAMKYLGESFDLHTGGVDNKFPHHENEIAQSEGATGRPFVRHWMHCSHLVVNGEKMSKSLGNFYTLRDLLARGHEPRLIRYLLVGTHYRNQLDFSEKALEQGRAELARIDNAALRLARLATAERGEARLAPRIAAAREAFVGALDDDLNVSGAMGEVFQLVRDVNAAVDRGETSREDARAFTEFLSDADRVFGVLLPWQRAEAAPPDVVALLEARQAARAAKDWPESDRLRDAILEAGFVIEDTKEGPQLKRRAP